jgi:hypothetical protein
MTPEILSSLLGEAQQEANRYHYIEALRIIREAKVVDLNNLYISALEQFVTTLSHLRSQELSSQDGIEFKQVFALMLERALGDEQRRLKNPTDNYTTFDELTLGKEKIKNLYFQRTDELLELHEYQHALEEIKRVYIFDPSNIVAKEYEQKLEQLIALDEHRTEH